MTAIKVRMYNVGLGDCILISMPTRKEQKHILIDFGSTRGKNKKYLMHVKDHILETVGDDPLAVVLTHGHLDHFKGLYYFLDEFDSKASVFLTTKYLRTSETRRLGTRQGPIFQTIESKFSGIRKLLDSGDLDPATEALAKERVDTDEMIDEICKNLGDRIRYLTRGAHAVLAGFLRGTGMRLDILAPEEDDSQYIEHAFSFGLREKRRFGRGKLLQMVKTLVKRDDEESTRTLLMGEREYDNATSLVLQLQSKKKRLLFAADAQESSWIAMHEAGLLSPVSLLKIAHHASRNGTPIDRQEIWSRLIDTKHHPPIFMVSTYPRKDWGMPDRELLTRLDKIGDLRSTEGLKGDPGIIEMEVRVE